MNLKKKKKGFTLIELMAVIAIIAILAAVLVPTVTGYINRSKKTAIVTQVRTIVNAVESYNATADNPLLEGTIVSSTDPNKVDITGSTPISGEGSVLKIIGTDLVDQNSINKLGGMTLTVARAINDDQNAVASIKIYPDGTFGAYKAPAGSKFDGLDVTVNHYNNGATGTQQYTKDDLK